MPLHNDWISVVAPTVVYVGITDRPEFDRIALPAVDHGINNPDRCVLTKAVPAPPAGVLVVFQHWYGPTPAERAADAAVALIRARADLVLDTSEPAHG